MRHFETTDEYEFGYLASLTCLCTSIISGPSEGNTVKRTEWNWELLNDMKAIWLRNPKEVTPEEYISFYRSLTKVCDPWPVAAWNSVYFMVYHSDVL